MNTVISRNTERDALKAGLELQFMVLLGEPLARTACFLEGDGFQFFLGALHLCPPQFDQRLAVATGRHGRGGGYRVAAMRDFANRYPAVSKCS